MLPPLFSKNGQLLPIDKAIISVDNIEFTYGFGVYENLKVRNRILYFPELHIQRLFHSAKAIGLTTQYDQKTIHDFLINLIKKIKEGSFNLKMLCVGNKEGSDLYILALAPKFLTAKEYSQGVQAITYKTERQFPQAKTLNMLPSYIAYKKAHQEKCYDALLVNEKDEILEGTRTNLFFTDGKTIFTAPEDKVLNGVTRLTLIEAITRYNKGKANEKSQDKNPSLKNNVMKETNKNPIKETGKKNENVIGAKNQEQSQPQKIIIKEKILKKDEINDYQGFFLTSTSSKIVPINKINETTILIPNLIKKVMKIYDEYLMQYASSQIDIKHAK